MVGGHEDWTPIFDVGTETALGHQVAATARSAGLAQSGGAGWRRRLPEQAGGSPRQQPRPEDIGAVAPAAPCEERVALRQQRQAGSSQYR